MNKNYQTEGITGSLNDYVMGADELTSLIDEVAGLIAEEKGHNVPYCESMDVSYLPIIIDIAGDTETKDILDDYNASEESLLGDLQFLARNGRVLPESLAEADFETFRAYAKGHKDELFREIQEIFEDYKKCYGNEADDLEDNDEDEDERIHRENKETAYSTIDLMKNHGVNFRFGWYQTENDTITVTGVTKDLLGLSPKGAQITDAVIHLVIDYAYYTIQYDSDKGPFKAAGMFDGAKEGEITPEDVEYFLYSILHKRQPDFLTKLLAACDEAGRVPTYIHISTREYKPATGIDYIDS